MQIISGTSEVLHRGVLVSGGEHTSSTNEVTLSIDGVSAVMRTRHPVVVASGDRVAICGEFGKGGIFNAYALANYTRNVSASCASDANVALAVLFMVIGAPFVIVGLGLIFVGIGAWLLVHNNKMLRAARILQDPSSLAPGLRASAAARSS